MSLVSVEARNASLSMSYGALAGAAAATSLEIALFNGEPGNGGSELTATGGYVAAVVDNDGTTWPDAPADGAITSIPVVFPTSTAAWSDTADWFLIRDADTGDEWDSGLLTNPVVVAGADRIARPSLTVFYEDLGA